MILEEVEQNKNADEMAGYYAKEFLRAFNGSKVTNENLIFSDGLKDGDTLTNHTFFNGLVIHVLKRGEYGNEMTNNEKVVAMTKDYDLKLTSKNPARIFMARNEDCSAWNGNVKWVKRFTFLKLMLFFGFITGIGSVFGMENKFGFFMMSVGFIGLAIVALVSKVVYKTRGWEKAVEI